MNCAIYQKLGYTWNREGPHLVERENKFEWDWVTLFACQKQSFPSAFVHLQVSLFHSLLFPFLCSFILNVLNKIFNIKVIFWDHWHLSRYHVNTEPTGSQSGLTGKDGQEEKTPTSPRSQEPSHLPTYTGSLVAQGWLSSLNGDSTQQSTKRIGVATVLGSKFLPALNPRHC